MKYGTVDPLLSGKACQTMVDCSGEIRLDVGFLHCVVVDVTTSFTVGGELHCDLQAQKKECML